MTVTVILDRQTKLLHHKNEPDRKFQKVPSKMIIHNGQSVF